MVIDMRDRTASEIKILPNENMISPTQAALTNPMTICRQSFGPPGSSIFHPRHLWLQLSRQHLPRPMARHTLLVFELLFVAVVDVVADVRQFNVVDVVIGGGGGDGGGGGVGGGII